LAIRTNAKTIRYDLGQRTRQQLRHIPELAFFLDDSLDYIDHIDQLLQK
jgi:ribosome-binding factor A